MKIPKNYRIKEIVKLLTHGYKFKEIATILKVSKSTIYKNYQEFRLNNDFIISDILYKIKVSHTINKRDIKTSLELLSYSDICILSKKFSCGYWIRKKTIKIEKLTTYLSMFFYFNINPVKFTLSDIKRAYYKKAKLLHPDITKIDTNKEFSNMKIIYDTLLKTIYL